MTFCLYLPRQHRRTREPSTCSGFCADWLCTTTTSYSYLSLWLCSRSSSMQDWLLMTWRSSSLLLEGQWTTSCVCMSQQTTLYHRLCSEALHQSANSAACAMQMSNLIITHNLNCVLRSLEEVLNYDDDVLAALFLDFTVGISPCQCFRFWLFICTQLLEQCSASWSINRLNGTGKRLNLILKILERKLPVKTGLKKKQKCFTSICSFFLSWLNASS